MRLSFSLIGILVTLFASAQQSVFDPGQVQVMVDQNKAEYGRQVKNKNLQLTSTATQTIAAQQANEFKNYVNNIHARFTQVFGLFSDLALMAQVATITEDIASNEAQMVNNVGRYPYYAPVATEVQINVVNMATRLVEMIAALVYIGTDLTQMNAADRHNIVSYAVNKFAEIDQMLIMMNKVISTAIQLKNPINPFQNYINRDQQYGQQALKNFNSILK